MTARKSRPSRPSLPLADGALIAAVAMAAFFNGMHGVWLDDDPVAITQNADVQCERGLWGLWDNAEVLWSNDFWGEPMSSAQSHLSYRPLTTLSFRLQHCLMGLHSFSFHAVNVALHALTCLLLNDAFIGVLPRRSQRRFAALLFALHSVHVEAVTNTVGRAELQCAVLFLLALRVYRPLTSRTRRSHQHLIRALVVTCARISGTIFLTGASMLCKEGGITAVACCATLDLAVAARQRALRPWRWRMRETLALACRLGALALGGVALLAARLARNGWRAPEFTCADNAAAFCEHALCRVLSHAHLHWLQFRLLLLPTHLAHDWSMTTVPNVYDFSDRRAPLAVVPCVLVLAALLRASLALRRATQRCSASPHRACSAEPPRGCLSQRTHGSSTKANEASLFVALFVSTGWLVLPFLPSSGAFVTGACMQLSRHQACCVPSPHDVQRPVPRNQRRTPLCDHRPPMPHHRPPMPHHRPPMPHLWHHPHTQAAAQPAPSTGIPRCVPSSWFYSR